MGLQKKLELIILIVLWLLQLSKAANNLFTDTFYNNFEGNNDKVISDSKSSNKRSASYSISHGIKGATSFMVGIADFDLVNSNFLDFNLYNSTVASKNPTTLTLDVGPNVGISSMAYHVIVSLTGLFYYFI